MSKVVHFPLVNHATNYYFHSASIVPRSPSGPAPSPVPEKNLHWLMEESFLWSGCPLCHPTISVKALMAMKSANNSHWPGLILSSSTSGLFVEGALLLLCWLSDVSVAMITSCI